MLAVLVGAGRPAQGTVHSAKLDVNPPLGDHSTFPTPTELGTVKTTHPVVDSPGYRAKLPPLKLVHPDTVLDSAL